jgi:glycosyltransferase involved in cell wall biosynthesis
MNRVAIVSYHAPPEPAIASHRVLRLSRVLLAAGHEVHWVSLPEPRLERVDPTLERLIPSAVRRHGLGRPSAVDRPAANVWQKIDLTVSYFLKNRLALPDAYVGWLRGLQRGLPRLIRREKLDTLYFCCGPHGPIVLIPWLRRKFPKLRILVDYRDLLSGNAWNYEPESPRAQRVLAKERKVLASADGLFLNTSAAYERFREVVRPPDSLPVTVMRNAADYDLAAQIEAEGTIPDLGEGVHLGYFGTVFSERRLLPVLESMAALPPELRARVRLHCYSSASSRAVVEEDCAATGLSVGREVVLSGPVPFGVAFLAMRAMDALVLANGPTVDDRIFVPGKLYDYLMARRPILFVGEPGDASRIVTDCCGAEWCSRHPESERRRAALELLAEGRPADLEPNEDYGAARTFEPVLSALRAGAASDDATTGR